MPKLLFHIHIIRALLALVILVCFTQTFYYTIHALPHAVTGFELINNFTISICLTAVFSLLCFIANCIKWKYRNDINFLTSLIAFISLLLFQIGRYELELLWPYWAMAVLLIFLIGLSYVAKKKSKIVHKPFITQTEQNVIQINIINNNPGESKNK